MLIKIRGTKKMGTSLKDVPMKIIVNVCEKYCYFFTMRLVTIPLSVKMRVK
jgi:hypothetical protein